MRSGGRCTGVSDVGVVTDGESSCDAATNGGMDEGIRINTAPRPTWNDKTPRLMHQARH